MLSQAQLQKIEKEKASEAQLNKLSETIIGQTAWGQFYGLMRTAASLGEGLIPHKVCLTNQGREIVVYKGTAGKVVGAWLKPQHEYYAQQISQGRWGDFIATVFFPPKSKIDSIEAQRKAMCLNITPQQLLDMVRNSPNYDPVTGKRKKVKPATTPAPTSETALQKFEHQFVELFKLEPATVSKINEFFHKIGL